MKTLRIGDASKTSSAFDNKLNLNKEGPGAYYRPFFIGWHAKNGGDEGGGFSTVPSNLSFANCLKSRNAGFSRLLQ
jgi:hypothetical protein